MNLIYELDFISALNGNNKLSFFKNYITLNNLCQLILIFSGIK